MATLFTRIRIKLFYFMHPYLWNKNIQLNGIPFISCPKNLILGNNVSINNNVYLQCGGGLKIGNNVTLSHGVSILTAGLETKDYADNANNKYRKHISAPVIIESGAWLCANVTITPGVEIAKNSIVAAGSVVTKSLTEPLALYGGVPAKFIKNLS